MVKLPDKQPVVKQFEVNGHPAIMTMTFSSKSSKNDGEGYTIECGVEDAYLRYFDGEEWKVILGSEEELKKNLLQNINDGILTTESIVNELRKREGVIEYMVDVNMGFDIIINGKSLGPLGTGPARILVVID